MIMYLVVCTYGLCSRQEVCWYMQFKQRHPSWQSAAWVHVNACSEACLKTQPKRKLKSAPWQHNKLEVMHMMCYDLQTWCLSLCSTIAEPLLYTTALSFHSNFLSVWPLHAFKAVSNKIHAMCQSWLMCWSMQSWSKCLQVPQEGASLA